MNNGNINYTCEKCNLFYVTYNGLWKHNKKHHGNVSMTNVSHSLPNMGDIEMEIKKFICKICKKTYNNRNSKYKHQKTCSENINNIKQLEIKFTNELDKLKTEINNKVKKKTINNNYGIINNITINKIGSENLLEFTDNEISQIFNKELESVIIFIELLNFVDPLRIYIINSKSIVERLPQNHSYCTTSLESKYLSTYNDETKTIEKDRKKYFFDKILNSSIDRIEILYKHNKNKFNIKKRKQIENNIINLKSIKNYDFNNKVLKEIINKMNLISYNKKNLIQKTWHEDSDSDDDFQRDLEKETKEEFYKKIERKKILELRYYSSDNSDEENE